MSNKPTPTPEQQRVIDQRDSNLLVSASAGTGKTTVMIERLTKLIAEGANVQDFVVVTYTKLAASEMKKKLADSLSKLSDNAHVSRQLELLDNASISTIHSFCTDLLRNYFYVVDIDPSFAVLDSMTLKNLANEAIDNVINQYVAAKDEMFAKVYKIYATKRRRENFIAVVNQLYEFSRNVVDFPTWYNDKKQQMLSAGKDNIVICTVFDSIKEQMSFFERQYLSFRNLSGELDGIFDDVLDENISIITNVVADNLDKTLCNLATIKPYPLPAKKRGVEEDAAVVSLRKKVKACNDKINKLSEKYQQLMRGQGLDEVWKEFCNSTLYTDKLVEVVLRYEQAFFALKKQRGGLDFGDLEHLTLQLLSDEQAKNAILQSKKFIYVDEYQDTNPVQEAIVSALNTGNNLFMVGDVKQSIYGFRGCEPNIFVRKYDLYSQSGQGVVVELNKNFRSNKDILHFVNQIFNYAMTLDFGHVDYKSTAQLTGDNTNLLPTTSVQIDILQTGESQGADKVTEIYDITQNQQKDHVARQGDIIAQRIKQYVGLGYKDKNGKSQVIGYGDIVILMRGMTDFARQTYTILQQNNIPVVASFKDNPYDTQELKELINLLRVIDNPYNEVPLVGLCLSCFGELTESELGQIRLVQGGEVNFYDRIKYYLENTTNTPIADKLKDLMSLVARLRFYSRSASVSEIVLKVLQETDYQLYVQGLPSGSMRLGKVFDFVDSLQGATYAQSVDKFLYYLDEIGQEVVAEPLSNTDAVRIMTMHSSKGLEFPIVFLCGLHQNFKIDYPSLQTNYDLGIACKHYDFEQMTVCETIGSTACQLLNTRRSLEEEMRLFYVATTRAQHTLHIVTQASEQQLQGVLTPPSQVSNFNDWLLGTLFAHEQQLAASNSQSRAFSLNIYQGFNEQASATVPQLPPQEDNLDELLSQMNYTYPYANQIDMPQKVVSSSLDKLFIDSSDQYEQPLWQHDDRNLVGTAYHVLLQYADYNSSREQLAKTIENLVMMDKIQPEIAAKLSVDIAYNAIHNQLLQNIISKGTVYHEIPFMLTAPYNQLCKDQRFVDKVMLQGVIDLLVVDGSKAYIVDYKYTSHSDRIAQNYTYQLRSYKMAVEQICGITDIECYVLSIADGKVIKM